SNSVLVTGTGSLWTNNGILTVGGTGAGNTLTIANTGMVISSGGLIGSGSTTSGSSNSVLVTGGGIWTNSGGSMQIGSLAGVGSISNILPIANGGQVFVTNGNFYLGHVFGTNNAVLVTDTGSVFSVKGNFNNGGDIGGVLAGSNSANNVVTIANGATLLLNR